MNQDVKDFDLKSYVWNLISSDIKNILDLFNTNATCWYNGIFFLQKSNVNKALHGNVPSMTDSLH